MSFPFDERHLRNKLRDLETTLRSSGTRRRISPQEQAVQNFGQSLFKALFVGDVRTLYLMSLDEAYQQDKGLRLRLRVQPPELTILPWEFLHDPDSDDYLCLSSDTPLVRYVDLHRPVRRLTVAPPLRILGMVASPRGLDPLDVEREKELMDEAIQGLQAKGLVELSWLEGQTWRDLAGAMRRGPWHVFHFVGHGEFDLEAEEGVIALRNEETGRAHLLESRDLARLLNGHRYLRLVFLNSCEGARGSEGDPFSGTAATLVRRGIPAVVAMQYEITDRAAIEFSRSFCESLADGWPVDAAVAAGRAAVSLSLGKTLEWGTPVLYMRSPDGCLFDISAEKRRTELSEAAERAVEARKREQEERLEELYEQAGRLHRNQEWQAVLDTFNQIHAQNRAYPDPEGLFESAREALERERSVTALYKRGQSHVDAREWQQALECFEEVVQLEPGYRDAERRLSQVRQELGLWHATVTLTASKVDQIECVRTGTGHTKSVQSVAFSPDGELLASGSWDNTIRLWRVENGELLRTLEDHTRLVERIRLTVQEESVTSSSESGINKIAFSPDGELLASAFADWTVRLRRVGNGKRLRTLKGHTNSVASVAFSPDSKLLASASHDNTIRLWGIA